MLGKAPAQPSGAHPPRCNFEEGDKRLAKVFREQLGRGVWLLSLSTVPLDSNWRPISSADGAAAGGTDSPKLAWRWLAASADSSSRVQHVHWNPPERLSKWLGCSPKWLVHFYRYQSYLKPVHVLSPGTTKPPQLLHRRGIPASLLTSWRFDLADVFSRAPSDWGPAVCSAPPSLLWRQQRFSPSSRAVNESVFSS